MHSPVEDATLQLTRAPNTIPARLFTGTPSGALLQSTSGPPRCAFVHNVRSNFTRSN